MCKLVFDSETEYARELERKMDRLHLFAREKLQQSSATKKQRYDVTAVPTRFNVGSGVWLHNPKKKKGRSPKLAREWEGPYVVVNHHNDVVVHIKRSARSKPKIAHVNRVKTY